MASSSERVKALRQYWSDRLGVDDVTKIAGYDPQGRYSLMTSSWKGKREAGWRKQLRFDITDTQIERELKGYGLYHRLTDGSDLPEVLDAVLEHNGAMVSTVEKMRIGIPVGGMSPGSDMESGGASYFFTRIRKLPEKDGYGESGLYLKPHLLRRMDAIIPAFAGTGFMTTMNMDGLQATMCGNIVKSDLRITNGLPGARVLMRLYSRTRSHCWTI